MNEIPYTIKVSARATRVRIVVHRDGAVVVVLPRRVSLSVARSFVASKAAWVAEKVAAFRSLGPASPVPRTHGSLAEFRQLRAQALVLVESRIIALNEQYGFKPGSVSIKNQKTRWGSCSKKGNMSFNYRIVLLPDHLRDYVIVHELCHLGEFNHSKEFWNLVARAVPDHRAVRHELNKSGLGFS